MVWATTSWGYKHCSELVHICFIGVYGLGYENNVGLSFGCVGLL